MKRKLIAIAVFIVFTLTQTCTCFAGTGSTAYSGASSWAKPELDQAAKNGLMTEKIRAKMSSSVTREEFAEIAVRLYEKCTGRKASYTGTSAFTDTKNPEIFKAYALKIADGTNPAKKLFSPGAITNREQVAAMLYRTIRAIKPNGDFSTGGAGKFSDEKSVSAWALDAVKFMSKNGFIQGSNGKFSPKGSCSRESAVIMALRIYKKYSVRGNWDCIVINDSELDAESFAVKEVDGSSYIFIPMDKFKYAFKYPYLGSYCYPYVSLDNGKINVSWKNSTKVLLEVCLQEGSTKVLVNGTEGDCGMAPYSSGGKVYMPVNAFMVMLGMEAEEQDGTLFIQYKDDFPSDILTGKWSDVSTDLFAGVKDIVTGLVIRSSFATGYVFNRDGTYILRMASYGTIMDTFIDQHGKYKVMGNTIMLYDIIETVYKGNPYVLTYKDKALEKPAYSFIENYDPGENKIEINGNWLTKRE